MKKFSFVTLASLVSATSMFSAELAWKGGAGEWNTTDLNWTIGGGSPGAWDNLANNADTAVISTNRGMITVNGTINLSALVISAPSTTTVGAISNSGYLIGNSDSGAVSILNFGSQRGTITTTGASTTNHQIDSDLTGSGGLSINSAGVDTGQGRLVLNGDNTGLTGGIIINSGLVSFASQAAAGSGAITLNGGGIFGVTSFLNADGATVSAPTTQTLTNEIIVNDVSSNAIRVWGSRTITLSGKISGAGDFTKTDLGTATLSGNLNEYSGNMTVAGGTLGITSSNASYSGNLIVNSGGILLFNRGQNSNNVLTTGTVTVASGGTLSMIQSHAGGYSSGRTFNMGSQVILNGGTLALGGGTGAQYSRLLSTTSLVVNNASAMTLTAGGFGQYVRIEGAVSGSGNLTLSRSGAGRSLQLAGNMSNYSGNVTITGDNTANAVTFGHVSGWGTGALTNTNTGSIVRLGDELATAYNGSFTGGTLGFTSGTMAATGLVTLNAGTILEVNNRASTYNVQFEARGGMAINGATLRANGIAGTSAFVPYANTTWTFGGTAVSTVSANLNMAHANATFDVADVTGSTATDVTVSGNISGSNALNKSGAGILEISGSNSAFTGGFNVNGGTLRLGSATALGSGAVILRNGSHLDGNGNVIGITSKLGGTGSVAGVVEIAAGGELTPGNSIGTLTFSGDVILHSGAKLVIEVNGSTNTSDVLAFSGTGDPGLSFESGASLRIVDVGGSSLDGKQFQIVTGGDITGVDFVNYSDASYSYTLSTSGVLSIAAVPEPSTYAWWITTGVVGLIAFRRRSKRGS